MSALARYFKAKGFDVAGYDRTSTLLTKELEAEGISIHYNDDVALIPELYKDPQNTMVVYTPAIPSDMSELVWFREQQFNVCKRSQALGEVTRMQQAICVSGTHGKTTTSTMIVNVGENGTLEESQNLAKAFKSLRFLRNGSLSAPIRISLAIPQKKIDGWL